MKKEKIARKQQKKWTDLEELELSHQYLSLQLSYQELAKRFSCSVAEVRGKVKEMGILQ